MLFAFGRWSMSGLRETSPVPILRVMTWNVHGAARPDPDDLGAVIRGYAPDVVALQEVRPRQAVAVARAVGWSSPLWSAKHLPYGPMWWRAEGHAVLTPLPQERGRAFVLSDGEHPFTYRRRIAQRLDIRAAGLVVRCWNVHLASGVDDGGEAGARLAQARRLLEAATLDVEPADAAVVMGDLNDGSDPAVRQVLAEEGFVDAWSVAERRVGRADGCTNPAAAPVQTLDHVMVRGRLAVEEVLVPDDASLAARSDHLPVIASLRLLV